MKVKSKVWLDKNGGLAFGAGKSKILKAVERTGSLNAAARKLNMSYRHAWSYIRSAEKRLGRPLLTRAKGGKGGGGAVLTEFARELIKKFDSLDAEVERFVNRRFREIFK